MVYYLMLQVAWYCFGLGRLWSYVLQFNSSNTKNFSWKLVIVIVAAVAESIVELVLLQMLLQVIRG